MHKIIAAPSSDVRFDTVCVAGTGHSGHVLTALLSHYRSISWFTRTSKRAAQLQGKVVWCTLPNETVIKSDKIRLTNNPKEALHNASMVILATPMSEWREYATLFNSYLNSKTIIIALQAQLPLTLFFPKDIAYAATDMLPFSCRSQTITHPEKCNVTVKSFKQNTRMMASSVEVYDCVAKLLNLIVPFPVIHVNTWLDLSLAPTNCFFHPPLMLQYLETQEKGEPVSPFFYLGIEEVSAQRLHNMEKDLNTLITAVETNLKTQLSVSTGLLSYMTSKYKHILNPKDIKDIRSFFKNNPLYKKSPTPMQNKKVDISHRYLHEDIPYGLMIWVQLANHLKIPIPAIRYIILRLQHYMHKEFLDPNYPNKFGKDAPDYNVLEEYPPSAGTHSL